MFVFAEAMAYGTILLVGLGATLLLAVLAMVFRHRGLGLTVLLAAVLTIGVIAWLKVETATYAKSHPSSTPPPTIVTTWTGSASLELSGGAFEPEAELAECRLTTGVVTSRGVIVEGAGRFDERRLRVSVFTLEGADPLVSVQAGDEGGSDPWAEWSGLGELQGGWLSGSVTFAGLTLQGSRGTWPGSVSGALSWTCDPATATP